MKPPILLLGALAGISLLSVNSEAQTAPQSDFKSAPDCARPADAKEAKIIDFDATTSIARLAVNLGSDRYKVVTIKAWDVPEDPRRLIPVIEAARITQGNIQIYAPDLNRDPQSAHESFVLMTEMGAGYVCWATPSALLNDGAYPVANQAKGSTNQAKATVKSASVPDEAKLAITPPANPVVVEPFRARTDRRRPGAPG